MSALSDQTEAFGLASLDLNLLSRHRPSVIN